MLRNAPADTAADGDGSAAAFQELQRCYDLLIEAMGRLAPPVAEGRG